MRYFDEGYGVRHRSRSCNPGDVFIQTTDSHRNWYGDTHGACFMTLSASSSRHICSEDRIGVNYAFSFLRSAPLRSALYASSNILHDGKTMTTIETDVLYRGKTACRAIIDYCDKSKSLGGSERQNVSSGPNVHPSADVELYRSSLGSPNLEIEDLIFGEQMKGKISAMGRLESFAVGMPTNSVFSDEIGFIDAGAYCALGDITLGVVARSLVGKSPTTQFSLCGVRPAEPGSRLVCDASIKAIHGRFAVVEGSIWADNQISAFVEGTYYSVE